jgi:hypothetical protein
MILRHILYYTTPDIQTVASCLATLRLELLESTATEIDGQPMIILHTEVSLDESTQTMILEAMRPCHASFNKRVPEEENV